MKRIAVKGFLVSGLIMLFLAGCLTTEYKEYRFRINSDGTGSGEIKYVNIMSEKDEGEDVSFDDFSELIGDYIEGEMFESENPDYNVTDKDLYEENGVLVGKVKFTFTSLDSTSFYLFEDCTCAPVMYYMGSLSETFEETNGTFLGYGRDFPVIFWDKGTDELYFKTKVQEDLSETKSLLPLYKTWEESNN